MTSAAQAIIESVHEADLSWLKVPKNEKECQILEETLEYLMDEDPSSDLIRVISALIKEYEDSKFEIPTAEPREVIRFLMEQHGLKQIDMVDIFTNQGNVSRVLNGKRGLSLENVKGLSKKFNVSAAVFI